jgi:sigma-E factor negative regulatory protein RseB
VTRHGLLLTAVTTVAVPGVLAMLAVLGHEHVTAAASAATLDGTSLAGAPIATEPTASPVARSNVVRSYATADQRTIGISLLEAAASADLATSYQGTEAVSQSDVTGSATTICRVWHQGGGTTLVETLTSPASPPDVQSADISVASDDPASGSPEGVLGVTKDLVSLLGQHYVVRYSGSGSVAERPTVVVDVYRTNNSLAARYWLDSQTMMPLRRELYDTSNHEISDDKFTQIEFGSVALPKVTSTAGAKLASPGSVRTGSISTAQTDWATAAAPGVFLASLAASGWTVPSSSPGGLPLYAAASTMTASGEIVDLEYSDGLYDISLFAERGTLAPDMSGWQRVKLAGQQAFVSGPSVTWARDGFVYTVIADAPPQTVTQVVAGLPGGPPGILDRLGRGLVRLASAINPFD